MRIEIMNILQERALDKLTYQWQSAYDLSEKINTLNALVRMGKAEVKREIGSETFPKSMTFYRLK